MATTAGPDVLPAAAAAVDWFPNTFCNCDGLPPDPGHIRTVQLSSGHYTWSYLIHLLGAEFLRLTTERSLDLFT
jgi:hypothetical protein